MFSSSFNFAKLVFIFSFLLLWRATPLHSMPRSIPEPVQLLPAAAASSSSPATVPAFPEQSDVAASSCPLDLRADLLPSVSAACTSSFSSGQVSRTKCCPSLAGWLYAAYSPTALSDRALPGSSGDYDLPALPDDSESCVTGVDRALRGRGLELPRVNGTCDVAYCYCGIRLRRLTCPGGFNADTTQRRLVPAGDGGRRLERDCVRPGLAGCSRCLRTLNQVKDVKWDARLGGQDIEMRLVEYFANEFNQQVGNGVDVRASPKAMAKLKKQVKRTKEILSANTAAPISVESLLDDTDFRSTITREKFEELCEDLWERAILPIKEVLKHSDVKLDEIYAVELIGGATRVPKLKAKLQEFLGRKDLDKHLDADEAIVLGASLHAANLSDGIKLNRKLGMIDGSSYGVFLEVDGPDLVKDETTSMLLVPQMKKMPIKMFRSIKHDKDFEVSLNYEKGYVLPPGVSSYTFAEYTVSGLTETSEKYASRNLSAPIKANLHFSLSRSGVLSLDRAEAAIEITEWEEAPKKNNTFEDSVTTNVNITSESNATKGSEDEKGNLASYNESNNSSDPNSTVDVSTEKVLKKKTFRVPLKIVEKTSGPGAVLSDDSLFEAKSRLQALDSKDAERRKNAELKNNLEEYIYSTKEKLEDNAEIEKVASDQDRQTFLEKLNEVQEWLYTDDEDASAKEFNERLELLKGIGDPIFFRLSELRAHPLACEHARTYLAEVQKIVSNWESNKPWLPKSRVEEVLNEANKNRQWLDKNEVSQKKNSPFATPVFTSEEVYKKISKLQDKVASVNRIPKPKPKVEKMTKQETDNQEDRTSTSNSTSEDSSSDAEAPKQDSADSSNSNTTPETEPHDEL